MKGESYELYDAGEMHSNAVGYLLREKRKKKTIFTGYN